MSNLACIGVAVADEDQMGQVLMGLIEDAVEDAPSSRKSQHLLWRDDSGAAVAFHLSKDELSCITPFFAAPQPATWRVRTSQATVDPECLHCSGADCDVLDPKGETVTRAAIQWLHFAPYDKWLRRTREFAIEVVAFAHWVGFYPDEAAFTAACAERTKDETGESLSLAPDFFLPAGLFGNSKHMGERAECSFAGTVSSVTTLNNSRTDQPFLHLRVDTLAGPTDIVCPPDACEGRPAVGSIAWMEAWLVGRPAQSPE